MNLLWKLSLPAVAVGAALWWASSPPAGQAGSNGAARPVDLAPPGEAALPLSNANPRPLPRHDAPYHGIAWQIHNSHDVINQARLMLGEIAELGADTVLISNAGYQEHAASESFQLNPDVTPSPEEWQQIFEIAHANGLRVILMPIILLSNPRGDEWRGRINPPSWDDWFEQYRQFLGWFARLAADGDVEVMLVGSELVSTEKYTDHWRRVIREVRQIFPGRLSYSANWDHYKVVEFWDDLDLIGMTSYYKLSSTPNPSLDALMKEWAPIKRNILKWQEKIDKPLLFTEVGWCSQEGATIEPWNYYYKQQATPAGLEEQRRCYRAFMDTWNNVAQVGGAIWWEWTNTPGGETDYNYTPKGKPAERELRQWFKTVSRRPSDTGG